MPQSHTSSFPAVKIILSLLLGLLSAGAISVYATSLGTNLSVTGTLTTVGSSFLNTLGIATTTPWGLLSVNPNGVTGPEFVIGSSTQTHLVVTNGGNVGVGTNAPRTRLDVVASNLVGPDGNFASSGGAVIQYGQDQGTAQFGFENYSLDKPILTLRTPNGFLTPSSGIQTVLHIQTSQWFGGSGSGAAIQFGPLSNGTAQSARIVAFGDQGNSNFGRMQLQTTYSIGGWNAGIKLWHTGVVTIGNPNDPYVVPSNALLSLYATTTPAANPTNSIFDAVALDNSTVIFRIDNVGNVGIGATNPAALLQISSSTASTLFQVTAGSNNVLINSSGKLSVGSTTPWGLLSVNANALAAGTPQFVVGSSTATNLIVANNGNVGVGTSSPSSLLSVEGPATATTTLHLGNKQSTTRGSCIQLYSTTGAAYRLYVGTAGTLVTETGACQ